MCDICIGCGFCSQPSNWKTTTEDYVGSFESRESIWSVPEYNGDPVSVALLDIGITGEILNKYPELGDYRVGLGLTNITVAFR